MTDVEKIRDFARFVKRRLDSYEASPTTRSLRAANYLRGMLHALKFSEKILAGVNYGEKEIFQGSNIEATKAITSTVSENS